ncbi:MAG: GvpL/GvpF family gas vesicle protein, partial [Desulfobacterales bacterium]|nr:GvpL/GvpF family gas vesicle protein [Desulfobacterales bacterium]
MSYLMYCIFADMKNQPATALPGIDGRPVEVVSYNGLNTAVSAVNNSESPVSIGVLQRFENVIAAFFARQAVIPLRYGNVIADKSRIGYHLKENAPRYHRLLSELDGCVEMGIRLLIEDCRLKIAGAKRRSRFIGDDVRNPESKIQIPKSEITGRAYLNQRKALYDAQDRNNPCVKTIIEQYRSAFSGIFVKFKSENELKATQPSSLCNAKPGCCNPQWLLSLFFLVPNG